MRRLVVDLLRRVLLTKRTRVVKTADVRLPLLSLLSLGFSLSVPAWCADLAGFDVSLDVPHGQARWEATVSNPDAEAATDVLLQLSVNGVWVWKQVLPPIAPGSSARVSETVSALDPFKLLDGGYVLQLSLIENAALKAERACALLAPDKVDSTLEYFHALAGRTGFIPEGELVNRRLGEVQSRLVLLNLEDVELRRKGKNLYKTDPAATVLGKIVARFKKREASESPAYVRDVYDDLGRELYRARSALPHFLFFKSPRRAAYDALIVELLKNGELKR